MITDPIRIQSQLQEKPDPDSTLKNTDPIGKSLSLKTSIYKHNLIKKTLRMNISKGISLKLNKEQGIILR